MTMESAATLKSLGEPSLLPLARMVVNTRLRDIPEAVVYQAKLSVLDNLGCIIRGFATEEAGKALSVEREIGGPKEATALVCGDRLPLLSAVRVNGYMGDIWELNDLLTGHAGIAIVPTALSMAEVRKASPEEFLTAVVLGYEVTGRIYTCYYKYKKDYTDCCCTPVGPPNSFGAAAVASRLFGLDVQTTSNALAASGDLLAMCPIEATGSGSTVKPYMFGGWAGDVGIFSAICARNGLAGTTSILEGRTGLFRTWAHDFDLTPITDGIGVKWSLERPRRKFHACCGYTHSPIDAALNLLQENGISAADIQKVHVVVAPYVYPVVGGDPVDEKGARFSLRYVLAVAMSKMSFITPEDTMQKQFDEYMAGSVPALIAAIEVEPRPGFPDHACEYPAACCRVTVTTRSGRTYTRDLEAFKGHPDNPMSDEDIFNKFRRLAACVFDNKRTEDIIRAVRDIDKMPDLSGLIQLLVLPASGGM